MSVTVKATTIGRDGTDLIGPTPFSRQGKIQTATWRSVVKKVKVDQPTILEQGNTDFPQYRSLMGRKFQTSTSQDDGREGEIASTPRISSDFDFLPVPSLSKSGKGKANDKTSPLNLAKSVADVIAASSQQTSKNQKQTAKAKTSAFLAPSRDQFVTVEMKVSSEMPSVGHYHPSFSTQDTEKGIGHPLKGKPRPSPAFMAPSRDSYSPSRTQTLFTLTRSNTPTRAHSRQRTQSLGDLGRNNEPETRAEIDARRSTTGSRGIPLQLPKDEQHNGSSSQTNGIVARNFRNSMSAAVGSSWKQNDENSPPDVTGAQHRGSYDDARKKVGSAGGMKRKGTGWGKLKAGMSLRMSSTMPARTGGGRAGFDLQATETAISQHAQRLKTSKMDAAHGGPPSESSAFKSKMLARVPLEKKSDCESDFYVSHESMLEGNSQHPRMSSVSLPLSRSSRTSTASERTRPVIVDKLYDVTRSFDTMVAQRVPSPVDLRKSTSRENAYGSFWKTSSLDPIYNPNDTNLSKRHRTPSTTLSHSLTTPAPSLRIHPPLVAHNTKTEAEIDYNRAEEPIRPRSHPQIPFGQPKTQPYLVTNPPPRQTLLPTATVDAEGNPLPAEMYDVNINPTRIRFHSQVPFGLAPARPEPQAPLTVDLDYSPDVTAGASALPGTRSVALRSSLHANSDSSSDGIPLRGETSSPPLMGSTTHSRVAPSLIRSYERSREALQSTDRPFSSGSASAALPQALVASTLLAPSQADFTLVSSGARQHVSSIDFSSYPTRAQVDPDRYKDKPLDKFYHSENAEQFVYPSTYGADFKKLQSRQKPIVSHTQDRPELNDLSYNPRTDVVERHSFHSDFSTGKKRIQGGSDSMFQQSLTADIPFYDTTDKWTKPATPAVSIAPVPSYGH
ncbi:uncharacterized protein MONOS_6784 [Monocercomonoides exilis]|uniref:uncharacterized protein n=1 Tax=Monocercomonoides exilis TaxID=2049356 RepID=UPI003559690D|nr:hypothetical protein MONOS_6784 [Monocercomonoides exilis]|eukprot:MONOS_6784.1-p1 / transcript=MONOS_6784.1 / gene=MONOS_6784 / organism=Monocercomonoides_exilis_PA203 / gene_product=unspecified product / transcript_product=unspecified product / location=Mono_scaffold00220:52341-55425(+) / protein_length=898 / sequence_SO=supercontig / SO=protein_coding / is_pseudo=false